MHQCKTTLNFFLFISFIVTVLAPLTGVHVHKMASTLFLLLTIVHTIAYRRTLGTKKYLLLCTVVIAFASGLLGMIFMQIPGIFAAAQSNLYCIGILPRHTYLCKPQMPAPKGRPA